MELKALQKFLDRISIPMLLNWLWCFVLFFRSPRRFFETYYRQRAVDQVAQVLLYVLLLGVFLYILRPVVYWDIIRLITMVFLVGTVAALIIYLAGKLVRINCAYFEILSFVFLLSVYGMFLTYLFNDLFIRNEDYTFRLIANIFTNIFVLFALFGYWLVKQVRLRHVSLAWLITVVLLNMSLAILNLCSIDAPVAAKQLNDPFIEEYNRYAQHLQDVPGMPYSRIITSVKGGPAFDTIGFISATRDTLNKISEEHDEGFRPLAAKNVVLIDSILPKLQFERTKALFLDLRRYYLMYSAMGKDRPCDTCFRFRIKTYAPDSSLLKVSDTYAIDSTYLKPRVDLQKKVANMLLLEAKTNLPSLPLSLLFYPYAYIGRKMGGKTFHTSTTF